MQNQSTVRKSIVRLLLALLCSFVSQWLMAQRSDDPASLVEKATQLSDLTELSVPFNLNAQIRIQTGSQKPVDATYRLEWISRESWRDELNMPQFEQIRTVLASRMWVERSIPYAPLQVWGAMEGIDIHSVLNMLPAPSLGNIRRRRRTAPSCSVSKWVNQCNGLRKHVSR